MLNLKQLGFLLLPLIVFAQIPKPGSGSGGGGGGGALPSGSIGCVQLYATSTTFAGCVATPAILGSDPGSGEVLRMGYSGTGGDSIAAFYGIFDVTPTVNITQVEYGGFLLTTLHGTVDYLGGYGVLGDIEINTTGAVSDAEGFSGNVSVNDAATVASAVGAYGSVQTYDGTTALAVGHWGWVGNYGGNIDKGINFYGQAPTLGGTMPVFIGYWTDDLAGAAANAYYSWNDSRGVGRCKEDNRFNSTGQSICVVYNPQFSKYTPGAINYERIVYGQWNSNVAEIGAEAGGTGAVRETRIIGKDLQIPVLTFSGLGTPSNSAIVFCSDCTNTSNLVAANTCTGSGSGAFAARINGAWKCLN